MTICSLATRVVFALVYSTDKFTSLWSLSCVLVVNLIFLGCRYQRQISSRRKHVLQIHVLGLHAELQQLADSMIPRYFASRAHDSAFLADSHDHATILVRSAGGLGAADDGDGAGVAGGDGHRAAHGAGGGAGDGGGDRAQPAVPAGARGHGEHGGACVLARAGVRHPVLRGRGGDAGSGRGRRAGVQLRPLGVPRAAGQGQGPHASPRPGRPGGRGRQAERVAAGGADAGGV
jgi:hypothetical protein